MEKYLFLLFALIGSILQSSAGFGNGVFLMAVLPYFLPFGKAVAYNQISCLFLTLTIVAATARKIDWKILLPLLIPMAISTFFFTYFSVSVSSEVLKIMLGVVFMATAGIFLFSNGKVTVKATTLGGSVMGILAGLSNGFTGISGPPAALYLRPAINDNNTYMATIQAFFLFQSATGLLSRMGQGFLETSDLVPVLFLLMGTLAGSLIGKAINGKLSKEKMQRYVYGFVLTYGAYVTVGNVVLVMTS
ncbi:MAG: sulfite exporter TauE/SafE family protein [Candidatus Ornithospirochaeta sp.]